MTKQQINKEKYYTVLPANDPFKAITDHTRDNFIGLTTGLIIGVIGGIIAVIMPYIK